MDPVPVDRHGRPAPLKRLCIASFINQGVIFPFYLLGIPTTYVMHGMDPEQVRTMVRESYSTLFSPEQMDPMLALVDLMHEHGVALMSVFALRTLVRFLGTLRMWQLKPDGFHLYTLAQLLGILVPMLIAGSQMLNVITLLIVLGWCWMYYGATRPLVPPTT